MKVDCTKPQSFFSIFPVGHGQNDVCLFPKWLDEKVAKLHLPAHGAALNVPDRGNALSWDRADHRTLKPETLFGASDGVIHSEFVARQTALAGSSRSSHPEAGNALEA